MTEAANDNGAPPFQLRRGEALKLLTEMPSDSIDAVICDPPYSSGGQFRGDRMQSTDDKYTLGGYRGRRPDFAGDNRDQRAFLTWCNLWMSECLRIMKPGAPMLTFTDWRQLPTVTDAVQVAGLVWRGIIPWDKTEGCRPKMGGFRAQAEFVVWSTKGPIDPEVAKTVGCLAGAYRFPVKQADKFHQTGKPTALMEQLVRVCPPGGTVLDPFAGSGTTLVAALRTGRRAIGFELVPEIADVAEARCRELEDAKAA